MDKDKDHKQKALKKEEGNPQPPEELNKNQRFFANMMADPEYRILNKTDMARKLGVSRPTLYKYLENSKVQSYIKDLVDYYTDTELSNVWKALIKQCKRGDIKAIKLYFEMKQLYVPPQQVVDFKMKDANATINIVSNIPRPEDIDIVEEEDQETLDAIEGIIEELSD